MAEKKIIMQWKEAILESKTRAVDLLTLKENARVLVLCCGIGTEAFLIHKKLGDSGYILGIDINESAIEIANKAKERYGTTNIDFVVEDANNIDEKHYNSFDVVLCIFGMHYFNSRYATIDYWSKFLAKDGELILVEWLKSGSNFLLDEINERIRKYLIAANKLSQKSNSDKNDISAKNIVTETLNFPFVYESAAVYWDYFKKNDLFYRLRDDLGNENYQTLLTDIDNLIAENNLVPITENKNVRITILHY